MQNLLIWSLILLCGSLFTICDSLSANWGKTGDLKSMLIVCILCPTTYLFFGFLNRKIDFAVAGSVVNLMIVIGTVLVGTFYFHETLSQSQLIGLFFACVAIILLNT